MKLDNFGSLESRCKNYSPEDDPNGAIGISLAEQWYQKEKAEKEAKEKETYSQISQSVHLYGFVREANTFRPDDIFFQPYEKAMLLKKYFDMHKMPMGKKTKSGKVPYRPIEEHAELHPAKIGKIFKNKLLSSEKKLKALEEYL